jgi:hypothetical protein
MSVRASGFYVYAYIDPRTNEPFYIGKGSGRRAEKHLMPSQLYDGPLRAHLAELNQAGHNPVICIIKDNLLESEALASERELIMLVGMSILGMGPLCNRSLDKIGKKSGYPTRESEKSKTIEVWDERFLSIAAAARDPRCRVCERTFRDRIKKGILPELAAETTDKLCGEWIEAFGEPFPSLAAVARDPRCDISLSVLQDRVADGETIEQAIYRYRPERRGRPQEALRGLPSQETSPHTEKL